MTSDASTGRPSSAPEADLSKTRLIILRALYALIVVGLALFVWPAYLAQLPAPAHYHGVTMTMLAAFSILCAVGIRYPLQMLPILLWELLWKAMWLLLIALPRWTAGTMDAATTQTAIDCLTVVLVLAAVPWGYVARNHVLRPAERLSPGAAAL
jgi:hypothetical protein